MEFTIELSCHSSNVENLTAVLQFSYMETISSFNAKMCKGIVISVSFGVMYQTVAFQCCLVYIFWQLTK